MNIKIIIISFVATTAITTSLAQTQVPTIEAFNYDEVTYTPEKTTFKLFAPKSMKRIDLTIYDKDIAFMATEYIFGRERFLGDETNKSYKMKYGKDGIWKVEVNGDLKGKYYTFNVADHTRWRMQCVPIPFPYRTYFGETPGVFAKAVGVNGKCGAIIDVKETNPEGWEQDKRPIVKSPADLVIYEMHHRDFSIDASSGILNKGKFLALTEPKAIQHLKELGVNAIHILPSYDFGSIDETRLQDNKYNWGYDPVNYNVPEGSYSTNPFHPVCRIKEFKQMVQALHKAGIKVILDVVYNHTYDIENSNFQKTYPDYYYRKNSQGEYSNGSGCGNETASDRSMMRRFMIESVKYWINEYHIDGFRFDLMGVHDIETMNLIREEVNKIDSSIFIYGEGWSAGECAYPSEKLATKANTKKLNGIAAFSDDMRDALRGPFNDDTKGAFLAGIGGEEESLKFGIVGAIAHPQVDMTKVNYSKEPWANEPTQQISYVSCHDDMCLVDRLKTEIPNITMEELIRLDLLAQTAVFTSQGVPFMLSGEEMLRDKKGVHNSFESPDAINHLDWDNLKRYPQVFQYYKDLIQLRKSHPAFRLGKAELVRKHLEFLPTEPCLVGFRLKNHAGGDAWNNIIVILNGNKEAKTVDIPTGNYTVVCCDGQIKEHGMGNVSGNKVIVDPQSALIIHE
ncbi:MAG: type I pullulanase [Prevotella sp.]|nr:type I pullulanase [Prevotella sp.]